MLLIGGIRHEWFIIGCTVLVLLFGGLILLYRLDPSLLSQLIGGGYKLNRIYGWLDVEPVSYTHLRRDQERRKENDQ